MLPDTPSQGRDATGVFCGRWVTEVQSLHGGRHDLRCAGASPTVVPTREDPWDSLLDRALRGVGDHHRPCHRKTQGTEYRHNEVRDGQKRGYRDTVEKYSGGQ